MFNDSIDASAWDFFMTDTLNVLRPTIGQDSTLGHSPTYTAVYSDIPCSTQPMAGSSVIFNLQPNIVIDTLFFVNQEIEVLNGDLIEFAGENYYVEAFRDLITAGAVWVIGCSVGKR